MATPKTAAEVTAADKLQDARKRNLDLAISQIQKEFGESAIMRMGDEHRIDVDTIPTGNLLIDRALGVGGLGGRGSGRLGRSSTPTLCPWV